MCSFGWTFMFSLKNWLCLDTNRNSLSTRGHLFSYLFFYKLLFSNESNHSKGQCLCSSVSCEYKEGAGQELEASHWPWQALLYPCSVSLVRGGLFCPPYIRSLETLLETCNVALNNNVPLFSILELSINHLLNESGLVNLCWQDWFLHDISWGNELNLRKKNACTVAKHTFSERVFTVNRRKIECTCFKEHILVTMLSTNMIWSKDGKIRSFQSRKITISSESIIYCKFPRSF